MKMNLPLSKPLRSLLVAATLAGFAMGAAQAADKVKLRLDWVFGAEHAPIFLAKEKGFFKEEGIDSAAFRRSFDHYAERPDEMKAIYEEVVERLRRMKDGADQTPLANDTTLATDSSSVRNR